MKVNSWHTNYSSAAVPLIGPVFKHLMQSSTLQLFPEAASHATQRRASAFAVQSKKTASPRAYSNGNNDLATYLDKHQTDARLTGFHAGPIRPKRKRGRDRTL
jgi:hypothetical protein